MVNIKPTDSTVSSNNNSSVTQINSLTLSSSSTQNQNNFYTNSLNYNNNSNNARQTLSSAVLATEQTPTTASTALFTYKSAVTNSTLAGKSNETNHSNSVMNKNTNYNNNPNTNANTQQMPQGHMKPNYPQTNNIHHSSGNQYTTSSAQNYNNNGQTTAYPNNKHVMSSSNSNMSNTRAMTNNGMGGPNRSNHALNHNNNKVASQNYVQPQSQLAYSIQQLNHHSSMQNIYSGQHSNMQQQHHQHPYNTTNKMNYMPGQAFNQLHVYQKQISLPGNANNYPKLASTSALSIETMANKPNKPYSSNSGANLMPTRGHTMINEQHNKLIPQESIPSVAPSSPLLASSLTPLSPRLDKNSIGFGEGNIKLNKTVSLELEKIDEAKTLTHSHTAIELLNSENNLEKSNSICSLSSFEVASEASLASPTYVSPKTAETTVVTCLADLIPDEKDFADKSEYFRNVVVAVDQLYPDTKWPLHNTWTFWHIKNDPNQSWEDNIKEVIDVSYVEDFWSVASHLYTPNNMCAHGDITFFKKGIRPMWEDHSNKNGGSWLHTIHQYKKYPEIYDHWMETLICLIGDNFCGRNFLPDNNEHAHEHICDFISGVYASPRAKQHRLALWTKNYKDEKTTRLIGKIWKNVLKINENITITFEAHETKYDKNANFKIVYKE